MPLTKTIRDILVPLEEYPHLSERASGVPVTLATVVKEGAPAARALTEMAEEAAAQLRVEGVDAETRLIHGTPAQALASLAREIGADLIVLGKRQGGLNRLLPNSPTDRLIGLAEWPVLIAKTGRMTGPNRG